MFTGQGQRFREGRREGKEGRVALERVQEVQGSVPQGDGPLPPPHPDQAEKGWLLFCMAACLEPGAGSHPWGRRSVHFQFIYVFYPQSGINACETDLIFMSTLRPGFDMSAFPVNCALRAICFSGRGD